MTTALQIIDAAVKMSTANDGGASPIADDVDEILGVLNQKIFQIYTIAGLPKDRGGDGTPYFREQWTVAVGTPSSTLVNISPTSPSRGWTSINKVVDASGNNVAMVREDDVLDGIAELPPAIILQGLKFKSAGRTGDPVAADNLTFHFSLLPAAMSDVAHYVGAYTPTDQSTSTWPSWVGDKFLSSYLAYYLAMKDGTRDQQEVQYLLDEMKQAGALLAQTLGVNFADLLNTGELRAAQA